MNMSLQMALQSNASRPYLSSLFAPKLNSPNAEIAKISSRNSFATLTSFALLGFLLSACGGGSSSNSSSESAASPALTYVNSILNIMQANALHRDTIVWPDVRAKTIEKLGNAQSISAADDAIRAALDMMGDHHSFLIKSNGSMIFTSGTSPDCSNAFQISPYIPRDIGYIRIDGNFQLTAAQIDRQAKGIQDAIRTQANTSSIGWVVDLRGNNGGNMWPMLSGIGPLLGEGTVGYFVSPGGQTEAWKYLGGRAILGDFPQYTIAAPYPPLQPSPKIAVLTDCHAGSSGEAIIVAFRARPNTRSFGTASYGVSTANQNFILSDGSQLYLTVSVYADRSGVQYGGRIAPDETINDPTEVITRSTTWLRSQ